jgi:hypothetical protein
MANARLSIKNIAELLWCNETLEAYEIDSCANYPEIQKTAFQAISIQNGSFYAPLRWIPAMRNTECGQHVVIVTDSNPNGEVDLCYR